MTTKLRQWKQKFHGATNRIGELKKEKAVLVKLIRSMTCPYPLPDNHSACISYCIDKEQCGCVISKTLNDTQ